MTPRVCALIPVYDHPDTVAAVVEGVRAHLPDILVVDDGSGPACRAVLDGLDGVELVRHPENQGKGAALASGFARARALGFSHALSIDADGQHRPEDLPALLQAVAATPKALVIGTRDLDRAEDDPRAAARRRKSRILRFNSNFWTWVETGTWVADTQSGFRAWPLAPLARLRSRGTRYELEVEALVQLVWERVPVVAVPVHADYGPGSTSHFRALPDFLRVTRLNLRLLALRACLPLPLLRAMQRRAGASLADAAAQGLRGSLALGFGLALAWAPLWGVRRKVARALGSLCGEADRAEDGALLLAWPLSLPFLFWAALRLGSMAAPELEALPAWLLGAGLGGLGCGMLGALLTSILALIFRRRQG